MDNFLPMLITSNAKHCFHRDVKPGNILMALHPTRRMKIKTDEMEIIMPVITSKLIDWGYLKQLKDAGRSLNTTSRVGTPGYSFLVTDDDDETTAAVASRTVPSRTTETDEDDDIDLDEDEDEDEHSEEKGGDENDEDEDLEKDEEKERMELSLIDAWGCSLSVLQFCMTQGAFAKLQDLFEQSIGRMEIFAKTDRKERDQLQCVLDKAKMKKLLGGDEDLMQIASAATTPVCTWWELDIFKIGIKFIVERIKQKGDRCVKDMKESGVVMHSMYQQYIIIKLREKLEQKGNHN